MVDSKSKDDKPVLTEYDKTMNTIKHENMFKGTVIICIVYAIFGFILLFIAYFSDAARDLLFNQFLSFTIVFIIGTILIIMVMLYFIFTFEPVKIIKLSNIDDISCPDYWKVKIIEDKYIGKTFDENYSNDFKYKCEMDTDIFDKQEMFKKTTDGYKLTNNFVNTSTIATSQQYYDSTKATNFDNDYKVNDKYYNLYKNVNQYDKQYIASNLGIFNDSERVNNITSNLQKIALLHNNYKINDKNNNAEDLTKVMNIYNTENKFSIWHANNTTQGIGTNSASPLEIVLNDDSTSNSVNVIHWNKLKYDDLLKYLNESNVNCIKVAVTSNVDSSSTAYLTVLGYIKKDTPRNYTDDNIYFIPTTNGIKKDTTTFVNNNNIVKKTMIINKTLLFKSNVLDFNHANIDISKKLSEDGPKLVLYDKSKNRPNTIDNITTATNNIPLICDSLYPTLLARFEDANPNNINNNDIRCAYSKICGIPWSDLRCFESK